MEEFIIVISTFIITAVVICGMWWFAKKINEDRYGTQNRLYRHRRND